MILSKIRKKKIRPKIGIPYLLTSFRIKWSKRFRKHRFTGEGTYYIRIQYALSIGLTSVSVCVFFFCTIFFPFFLISFSVSPFYILFDSIFYISLYWNSHWFFFLYSPRQRLSNKKNCSRWNSICEYYLSIHLKHILVHPILPQHMTRFN